MPSDQSLTCILLAGGKGTRLTSVVGDLPKHLVPVGGEPFAALQLRWLQGRGVSRVVYCVGHGADQIERYVREHGPRTLEYEFVRDGATLLGTGGAVRSAHDRLAFDDDVLVLYGDTLLDLDLRSLMAAHRAHGLGATMSVFHNDGRFDTSNASFDGRLVRYDKHSPSGAMTWIDYGASALSVSTIAQIRPSEPSDLAELFQRLGDQGQLGGFVATERFYEIGTPSALQELESRLRSDSTPKTGANAHAH